MGLLMYRDQALGDASQREGRVQQTLEEKLLSFVGERQLDGIEWGEFWLDCCVYLSKWLLCSMFCFARVCYVSSLPCSAYP